MRDDRGSALILGVGMVAVCLLAVVVLVDASAAFLQRRELVSLADAAALAGAQGIDLAAYYADGAGPATRLDPSTVTRRVHDFLAGSDPLDGMRIDDLECDGRVVRVVLSAPLTLPFLQRGSDRVVVESRARLSYAG